MKRGIYLTVGVAVVLGAAVIVSTAGAQVYPVRWYEDQPEPQAATPPSFVLADGDLQFPDGTVQMTAAGNAVPPGAPSPSLVAADGGIQFSDGSVQMTAATAAGSLVPQTGQTICYDAAGNTIDCATDIGPGQDGDLQKGAPWPNPRFTINENSPGVSDGTVTDNLTGLIWLADANCFSIWTWEAALTKAATLFDGCMGCGSNNDCGLADGSVAGQWRLPNVRELQSLMHFGVNDPAVPNTAGTGQWSEGNPFANVQPQLAWYWSSTSAAGTASTSAWHVYTNLGGIQRTGKGFNGAYVWPVRGGQ